MADKILEMAPRNAEFEAVTICIAKWIPLGSTEAKIASNLQNISVNNEQNTPKYKILCFHQKCYNKLSDKTRIEAAINSSA